MAIYDQVQDTVRAWLEAGADTINLVLPSGLPEQQLLEMLEAAAPAALTRDRSPRSTPATTPPR